LGSGKSAERAAADDQESRRHALARARAIAHSPRHARISGRGQPLNAPKEREPSRWHGGTLMLFDYISVNTYWTILFTIHGLLAIALLGALTHQAASVLFPVRQPAGDFVTRFRA